MSSENNDTRKKILKASLRLLEASKGLGVRMSDIAKAAGVSRQAVYLHFSNRADLLIATTHYLDDLKQMDQRLSASRTATTGAERLEAYIDAWGKYIPEIYGIAKALIAMGDTDGEAKKAWAKRMQDMREGCQAAIDMLADENRLNSQHSRKQATDILWTMLSVKNWEQLTQDCGWTQQQYIDTLQTMARQILLNGET